MEPIKTKAVDFEEPADVRAFVRGLLIAVVFAVNAFAERLGYVPLTGVESTAIIGFGGVLVYAIRKLRVIFSRAYDNL